MPQYEYECEKHGPFALTLPLSKWDDHKPCPKCKRACEQVLRPREVRGVFEVGIVVHVGPDGAVRFPGHRDAKCPPGFRQKELKSIREVEQFERNMNQKLRNEAEQHNIREERFFSEAQSKLRGELRQEMQHFSPQGRAFAEFAMNRNNNRKRKSSEVGFHVNILHFDASNREAYRDEQTGWRARKD
jgi:putative FmdB family regulatory protein